MGKGGQAPGPGVTNVYDRAAIVDANFKEATLGWSGEPTRAPRPLDLPLREGATLTGEDLLELFDSQIVSRHLDLVSRALRARDRGYYTIGSAGHEGNVVLGRLTRSTDPAFLHYRSGALMAERSRHAAGVDFIRDTLLSVAAAADDPASGGRHKVWGSAPIWVLPQTSTIASHLPKAVGTAIGIGRARKLGIEPPVPRDSIVLCSFGDASVNHSTALGAFSAAVRAVYQQVAAPVLFVCEDNGIGISVRTPPGWVEDAFARRPGLRYFSADGLDLIDAHRVAREAIRTCRTQRRPVFLHLRVVRLLGHAGSDVELEYRTREDVEATEARDPLLATARTVLETGLLTPSQVVERYQALRGDVERVAEEVLERPLLASAAEVVSVLAPYRPEAVAAEAAREPDPAERERLWGGAERLPERGAPRHLAASINAALHDLMIKYPQAVLFGEDVAQKGGVYHVTAGLLKRFGHPRVFNTVLDEQTILGLAQGLGYMGLLPVPEIQYLAYFHNACDQIRGEACSMQFFSKGQFSNPMVIRIASFGYQKGFGGHFHNDNSVAALRDIPGLVLAAPSRGDDAVRMLRSALAMARVDGRVVAFLEPIALYMTRDLHEPKDGEWSFPYPAPGEAIPLGEGRVYHEDAGDLLIASYANGVPMALRAARRLRDELGARARVLDLRWLNPLPEAWLGRHATECGRVVVLDEGRRSGGVGEAMVTAVVEHGAAGIAVRRVAGVDTYIPLGPVARRVLPDEDGVVRAAKELLSPGPSRGSR
jgi:2-oxoisovalerate dehydrogenase E1 component